MAQHDGSAVAAREHYPYCRTTTLNAAPREANSRFVTGACPDLPNRAHIERRIQAQLSMTSSSSPLKAEWVLPSSATLGSSVRAKGIERELRRRVPWTTRKHVTVGAGRVSLSMPEEDADAFSLASERISEAVALVAQLPVLPSEVEDILAISSRERHKWMKDGRLTSIGTRTVKLRGRAKAVTFHVFDARQIEDLLDGDVPAIWREEDARVSAENRRRAAGKAALARARKLGPDPKAGETDATESGAADLKGWDEFDAEGLLR